MIGTLRTYLPKRDSNVAPIVVDMDSFGTIPQWDPNTTLLIWGPPGKGKTTLAKNLIENPLFISHMDKLKDFDPTTHGGIIFDDMSFAHFPRTAQIALVDVENDRQIHVRYTYAEIPAGTKKIVTTNDFPEHIFLFGDEAIRRRLTVWKMERRDFIVLQT